MSSQIIYDPSTGKYFEISPGAAGGPMNFRETTPPPPSRSEILKSTVGKPIVEEGARALVKKGLESLLPSGGVEATPLDILGGGPLDLGLWGSPDVNALDAATKGPLNIPMGATTPESSWGLMGGGGGIGPYAVGAAGAYGLYDLFMNRPQNMGTGKGALQGATSGAALGTAIMPGWGTAIGAGLGGVAGLLSTKSRTRVEEHLRDKLAGQGINVPTNPDAPHGKAWELNPTFAKTRKESDLTGADIKDAAWFYANVPNYGSLTDEQRISAAQEQLNKGLIREHHGTIEGQMTPDYSTYLEGIFTPTASSNSGDAKRERERESRRSKAKAVLDMIAPQMTQGPRYDLAAVGQNIKNPYLGGL